MTISDIEELEERLRRAMLSADVAELDRLVSGRLLFVTPNGATIGKEADLDAHRSGLIRLSALIPLERRIEHFGVMAVVNVEMEMAGIFSGEYFCGRFRYTRVWHQEGLEMKVVAGHVCSIK